MATALWGEDMNEFFFFSDESLFLTSCIWVSWMSAGVFAFPQKINCSLSFHSFRFLSFVLFWGGDLELGAGVFFYLFIRCFYCYYYLKGLCLLPPICHWSSVCQCCFTPLRYLLRLKVKLPFSFLLYHLPTASFPSPSRSDKSL